MKSGLEGRNNEIVIHAADVNAKGLNEVRPRRPEQSVSWAVEKQTIESRLNEVRPRRPEQFRNKSWTNPLAMLSQ